MNEVALTVQFAQPVIDLDALGLFGARVRKQLPGRQAQPLLPPMEETFDLMPPAPGFEIRFDNAPLVPRTWFLSPDGEQIVQLQPDRMSVNWRDVSEDKGDYPRYDRIRTRLEELLSVLEIVLSELDRPLPAINMCEASYVNPIQLPGSEDARQHPDLAKIINRVRGRPRNAFLPDAEDAQLQVRWRIPAEELPGAPEGPPVGRLHLQAGPGLRPRGNVPIYVVTMTARVKPAGGSVSNAWDALDVAHKWIVLGFTDVTTSAMHKIWGMKDK
ncbi:MAG: TIGR04255 family protein [Solirubrobacterales bacterium]|nr:TIGR04255 family protein [Solirubrobacterales bacterium]